MEIEGVMFNKLYRVKLFLNLDQNKNYALINKSALLAELNGFTFIL